MKKIIEVSIGSINFTMEDDAYIRLKEYFKRFESTIHDKEEAREVMIDVEARVAEIFQKEIKYSNQVVDMKLVQSVIDRLGDVDPVENNDSNTSSKAQSSTKTQDNSNQEYTKGNKRLYRDIDSKKLGGVASGLSAYTGIDVTIIRVLFVVLSFAYGSAFLAYIILWFVMPKAQTVSQKLEMRGYAQTAENIRKFTSQYK